jgi:hypothetical protein
MTGELANVRSQSIFLIYLERIHHLIQFAGSDFANLSGTLKPGRVFSRESLSATL